MGIDWSLIGGLGVTLWVISITQCVSVFFLHTYR